MTPWLRARSVLDRVVAAVLLGILAPVILVLAWSIRRQNDGPAFVRLQRVGQGGEHFDIWKLRTMRVEPISPRGRGPALSKPNDDRITPVGRSMRRYRLDEFPQLLNVIRGEMALIGPRPEDPVFVDATSPLWVPGLASRPGVAGITQVLVHDWEAELLHDAEEPEGLYRESVLPIKLETDRWYIQNAAPMIDLMVVVALIERFLFNRRRTIVHRRILPRLPSSVREELTIPDDREQGRSCTQDD